MLVECQPCIRKKNRKWEVKKRKVLFEKIIKKK